MLWYFGDKLFESNVSLYALQSFVTSSKLLQSHTDPRIPRHRTSSDPPADLFPSFEGWCPELTLID